MSRQDWQQFLQRHGAQFDNDWLVRFQDPPTAPADKAQAICALTQLACLEVKGDEAQSFLQNQLSNDIRLLDDQSAQLSAYCSAKGRVISLFWVIKRAASYFLLLPRDRAEATLKRLRMFVLMSQVEINDVSDDWHCIGVIADQGVPELAGLNLAPSASPLQVTSSENLIAIRCHGIRSRFLLLVSDAQAQSVWQALLSQGQPRISREWIGEDIDAGVPQVYQATSEAFVPQMLNLHSLNAISFSKGCYPGQEVVARMKYLGKLKRRMYAAEIKDIVPITAGDEIVDDKDSVVGQVVDVATSRDGATTRLLAVLQVSASEQTLFTKGENKYQLNIKDLPYEVELEST